MVIVNLGGKKETTHTGKKITRRQHKDTLTFSYGSLPAGAELTQLSSKSKRGAQGEDLGKGQKWGCQSSGEEVRWHKGFEKSSCRVSWMSVWLLLMGQGCRIWSWLRKSQGTECPWTDVPRIDFLSEFLVVVTNFPYFTDFVISVITFLFPLETFIASWEILFIPMPKSAYHVPDVKSGSLEHMCRK